MIKDHAITIGLWNVHISGVRYFPYHPLHHILGQEEVVFVTNHPEAQRRGFRVKPQSIIKAYREKINIDDGFNNMKSFLKLSQKIETSGMTLEQIITLASVIEKETGQGEQRPIIASVFLNRLKKGMRLENDPTVIYGIKDFNGNLTKKDLMQSTPYNTHVIRGLPSGPIAFPGEEAIQAALFPAKTDFLYFVSRNDGNHHFSRTLSEHSRAVTAYQRKGRKRNGEIS